MYTIKESKQLLEKEIGKNLANISLLCILNIEGESYENY